MTNDRVQRIVDVDDPDAMAEIAIPDTTIRDAAHEATVGDSADPTDAASDAGAPTAEATTTAELDDDDEVAPAGELAPDASAEEPATAEDDGAADDAPVDDDAAEASADDDSGPEVLSGAKLTQTLEALLFVADEPIAASALGRALGLTAAQVRRGLDDLGETLRDEWRGVRLQQGPDGAQLVTASDVADAVEHFLGLEANRRLSNAALETLAIIAYRQPVTRHVIEQIRGVSSDGAVATLRARGLIEGIGRAPGPGRPLLFSTTQRFLEHFGLERPDELPPLPDDVELPPEDAGAQLELEAAVEGEVAEGSDEVESDQLAPDDVGETVEARAELEDEDADAFEEDPDLEISEDLEELSRAAGAAFAAPAGAGDGPSSE